MTLDMKTSPEHRQNQENTPPLEITARRKQAIRTTLIVAALMLLVTSLQSVFNLLNIGAWQILVDLIFGIIALAITALCWRFFQMGEYERITYLLPVAAIAAFAPGELFLEGVTSYNIITFTVLSVAGYFIFLPQKRVRWFGYLAGFLVYELIFSQVHIFNRIQVQTSASWSSSLPIISLVLLIAVLSQYLSTVQLRTIQSKMLVSIISLSLIPAFIIGAVTMFLGSQETTAQIGENLQATSLLKVEQINSWLAQSTNDLSSLLQKTEFVNNASLLPYFTQENYYHTEIMADMAGVMENTGNFNRMYIIGPEGNVLLSSDRELLGMDLSTSELFTNGLAGRYITPARVDPDTNQLVIQIALPIQLSTGEISSVLVGDLDIEKLLAITFDTTNLGDTGESFLMTNQSSLLTPVRYSTDLLPGRGQINLEAEVIDEETSEAHTSEYLSYAGQNVIGSHTWLPDLNAVLVIEQNQSEAFETINFTITLAVIIAAVTAVVATSFAVAFTRSISGPIKELSDTASLVSSREQESMEPIDREDEIGDLSRSLSEMTSQMLQTSQNLEKIVAQRTAVLERRAAYLETTAEIGRAITNIRNLSDLLTTVSHLISEKFGFYHVGIFIIDPNREFAVLRASNSEGGWRMLAREHKLRVGEQGIVGFVTGTGQPRIQQQVEGEDSVYYNNPDLPMTKSEMALPMISSGEILGCLDVQSTDEQAFSDEDVRVLQVLADEIAVAVTNVNLFEQLQESLETERRVFGQITQDAWRSILQQDQTKLGFRADFSGVQNISDIRFPESQRAVQSGETTQGAPNPETASYPLSVPIKVRGGHVVAVIETQKPVASGPWTNEEISVLEGVGEQLGVALENARLFQETQKNAQRERIAADLSGKIWSSTDIDTILQTAVRELGNALSASEGSISLALPEELGGTGNSNDGAGEA